ncbi:phosphoglucan phosphatase LSF1, chloroplastic isoform X2 [Telopea speciosissima]|uniref:phosphoglucan phosphatase LSF1, chloroplastic isoform X2 n=1 Tax=Telopea speciosissima TaxID=54955 RepID=UPI001CC7F222|nr:phosphoglucan phosphatase LSF1, chloroplastic isoform X2 [Telopea speciosissima]
MSSLQLSSCMFSNESSFPCNFYDTGKIAQPALDSSFWGRNLCLAKQGFGITMRENLHLGRRITKVYATVDLPPFNLNLNEYMVTLEKPLGIRFALSVDGRIFVHALKKGGNAEKSRIIMVGDTLKRASNAPDGKLPKIKDFGDTLGRLPMATWNRTILASHLQPSSEHSGNSGFITFSSKFLSSQGWKLLNDQKQYLDLQKQNSFLTAPINQLVCIFSEEESGDVEWAHGSFPLAEYIKALDRSKGELYYNHLLGMQYGKITEQIYMGSCIQTKADVETLSSVAGVTAVLNFQSEIEATNWGINSESINHACRQFNILMINYPIREVDSFDLRKKLPFSVGLLLRLLKKNLRVFVTCTSGFDRSPACVIAYLHWMTDTSLHAAYNFVTGLHSCRPDRPAIAWATWDLIAMVENGRHDGPATHAVTFVWNGQEGEDVRLVGDFTGNWKESIEVVHKGGSKYEAEVRLPHGKYYYKFIINGNWRNSSDSPTESDERGNLNNVIIVGDIASVRPKVLQQKKDAMVVKVIERPLTETERFMLAKAARCMAFSICPITLAPK